MKIIEISPQEGFKLFLRYDDGVAGVVDLSSLAGRGVFASWLEPNIFQQVRLTEAGALEWPGEVDLCAGDHPGLRGGQARLCRKTRQS